MTTLGDIVNWLGIALAVLGFGTYFAMLALNLVRAATRRTSHTRSDRLFMVATYSRIAGTLGLFVFVLGTMLQNEFSWPLFVFLLVFAGPYAYLLVAPPMRPDNPFGFDPKRVPGLKGPDRLSEFLSASGHRNKRSE